MSDDVQAEGAQAAPRADEGVQDLTAMVQNLMTQLQDKFQSMSDQIVARIDDMGTRVDELEKTLNMLIVQSGSEEK
eukprot:m.211714 g.211714  ORF g.211714 m.211714 type:complete len:76 (-) comp18763_c0_seq1:135-362(-)